MWMDLPLSVKQKMDAGGLDLHIFIHYINLYDMFVYDMCIYAYVHVYIYLYM
jgi:cellulose synthase/poly-beta-1,6-N-acetylglucosamine synthase-like glycosyltransferase